MHDSFWGITTDTSSPCSVVGFIGEHKFPRGGRSRYTYIVECAEGHHYAATHTTVADALADVRLKRQLMKPGTPPPRAVQ